MFYSARQASKEAAQESVTAGTNQEQELNLDTFSAYLAKRYPDRKRVEPVAVSELINQLHLAGYKTLDSLQVALDASKEAFAKYEPENPPINESRKYADVGVVRLSLAIADHHFADLINFPANDPVGTYRRHVHPFELPRD